MLPMVVGVVAPPGHPSLPHLPDKPGLEFIVGNSIEEFEEHLKMDQIETLIWVVPGSEICLEALYKKTQVKWVHSFSAGVDGMAVFLKRREIDSPDTVVTNGRSAFSSSLAEYVFACALHFNKQVPRLQANKEAQKWDNFVMPVLSGKTIGFLGFGDIPKATAKIARESFGMKVLALRRNPGKIQAESSLADETLDFATQKLELFKRSDFVVSVLPGTLETKNFVGRAEFEAMKSSGIFISIGRGMVVDETALAYALRTGSIAGAALDVYKVEPLPEDSTLWDCPNLLMSSHNADLTEDYFQLGWKVWEKNAEGHATGEYATVVDKSAGY